MPALDDLREQAAAAVQWPPETRLPHEDQAIQEYRSMLRKRMGALVEFAERCDRDLSAEELREYDALEAEDVALEVSVSRIPERGMAP